MVDSRTCWTVQPDEPAVVVAISDMLARIGDKWSLLIVIDPRRDATAIQRAASQHRRHQPEDALLDPEGARARRLW